MAYIFNIFSLTVFVTDSTSTEVTGFSQQHGPRVLAPSLCPFGVKKAHAVRERAIPPMSEEDWTDMQEAITGEHKEERARDKRAAG